MPNFTASIRTTLRDVEGLVLSCGRNDIEEDSSHPGFVKRWINRAPGLPSKPAVRNPGDAITYPGGRYSNPQQLITANQPQIILTGGGQRRVQFNRSAGTYLQFTIPGTFPEAAGPAFLAYQFEKRPNTSNGQHIYDDNQSKIVLRRRGAGGQAELKLGVTTCTAASDHIDGACIGYTSGSNITWRRQNSPYATQAGASNPQVVAGTGYLGRGTAGGTELDGILDSFHVWHRQLSPFEIDFIWHTLHEDGASFTSNPRTIVKLKRWTDTTGTGSQPNRLRAERGAEPYYRLATVTGGGSIAKRVQIAAAVDGKVLADSALGGNLFALSWIEAPGASPMFPVVNQDAGWSAVFDCSLKTPGHYCAMLRRTAGGSVMLHFDVEVVA